MTVKCKTYLAKGTSSANECMVVRINTNGGRKYVDEFGNVTSGGQTADHVISTNAWSTREWIFQYDALYLAWKTTQHTN
mgnify:FL=1